MVLNAVFDLPPDAICELELIQLELKHGRHVHLRHFIDRYYCHKHGLLNSRGNANWNGTLWQGIVSTSAWDIKRKPGQRFHREHVVPIHVISQLLIALPMSTYSGPSLVDTANLIDRYLRYATITKAENSALNNGLRSTMPTGFTTFGNPIFDDPLARYKEKKIAYGDVFNGVYTHVWP